jgi:uncharacterized alpha-E superfamily protein
MLLCRLAENAYWLGRYLERAEDLARAILAFEEIRLDMPGQRAPGWQRLAACAGVADAEAAALEPSAFVARVVLDRKNPSAILGALNAARENLRRARSLFPAECWYTLNPLYLQTGALGSQLRPAELRVNLERIVGACRELAGHIQTGMLRDEGYAFFRMGVQLERSDMTLRVATVVAETLIPTSRRMPFEDVRWMGLLKSVGAYGTYRHRYHAATDFQSALQLLLFEPTFPRSLTFGLDEVAGHLAGLPANEDALSALRACRPAYAIETREALAPFADDALARLAHASAVLERSYFTLALPVTEGARPRAAGKRHPGGPSSDNQRRDPEPPVAPVT